MKDFCGFLFNRDSDIGGRGLIECIWCSSDLSEKNHVNEEHQICLFEAFRTFHKKEIHCF
jgi:hypothetical protein